jgi:uncharacterized protein (DUF4415 family)
MKKSLKPLTNKEGEVRELTLADMRRFRPTFDVLPSELVEIIKNRKVGQRGPQVAPVKQQVTLRLDRDVLDSFRASGAGWQSRINEALRKTIAKAGRRSA